MMLYLRFFIAIHKIKYWSVIRYKNTKDRLRYKIKVVKTYGKYVKKYIYDKPIRPNILLFDFCTDDDIIESRKEESKYLFDFLVREANLQKSHEISVMSNYIF